MTPARDPDSRVAPERRKVADAAVAYAAAPHGLGWLPKSYTAVALADIVAAALERRGRTPSDRPPRAS